MWLVSLHKTCFSWIVRFTFICLVIETNYIATIATSVATIATSVATGELVCLKPTWNCGTVTVYQNCQF